MDINYITNKSNFNFKREDPFNSFFLSNSKNAFLNYSVKKIFDKTQGYSLYFDFLKEEFKILDEIVLDGVENFNTVEIYENSVKRFFQKDGLEFYDNFFLNEEGILLYSTNFLGDLLIDFDIRRRDEFDKFGRFYSIVEQRKDYIIFKYELKSKKGFTIYFGVKHNNLEVIENNSWVLKDYTYTKLRNSEFNIYVYRSLKLKGEEKKLAFYASFDKDDLISKLESETNFQNNEIILEDLNNFKILLPEIHHLTYTQAKKTKTYLKRDNQYLAGGLWFSDVWIRDYLVGLSADFNSEDKNNTAKGLIKILRLINKETGKLTRIEKKGALDSFDGVFWLGKRIFDFSKLFGFEQFTPEQQEEIFETLYSSWDKIFNENWDYQTNTLNVEYGDSWMDTIELKHPMDMHIQLLGFTSYLIYFARVLNKNLEEQHLGVVESFLSEIFKQHFYKDNLLIDEINSSNYSCNIFLAYYFYKDLFSSMVWEEIFDNALQKLQTTWGGIASVNENHPQFQPFYTGENNLSYHRGDVWYWITALCGVVLNDLNKEKYYQTITEILDCLTNDILTLGCIGSGSELSSYKQQEARGNLVQLWSNTVFMELINDIYKIKR